MSGKFVTLAQYVGRFIVHQKCDVIFTCGNDTIIGDRNYDGTLRGSGGKGTSGGGSGGEDVCFTAPFIHCPENRQFDKYTPLWNAHIHSKNLEKYVSQPCPCR